MFPRHKKCETYELTYKQMPFYFRSTWIFFLIDCQRKQNRIGKQKTTSKNDVKKLSHNIEAFHREIFHFKCRSEP